MSTTYCHRQVVVSEKIYETTDICGYTLVDPAGAPLPSFTAGAHIDVCLGNGLIRSYSLCNDPQEVYRYQLSVRLDPASRGGSSAMHRIKLGETLHISEPRNFFPLVSGSHHSILIGGGIGITPLLAMAYDLHAHKASFELHYATRSARQTAFRDRLSDSPFSHRVYLHHDDEQSNRKPDLDAIFGCHDNECHVYICGPSGFMAAVMSHALEAGWSSALLHTESFGRGSYGEDGSFNGSSFEVVIRSTGKSVWVGPQQSVVSALAQEGIKIPISCEQGVCGTCITRIFDGIPDHKDLFLTPEEQAGGKVFTPCCSRAKSSKLVLDL